MSLLVAGQSSGCNSSARRNIGAVVVEVLSEVNINGLIYQEDLHQVSLSFVCLLYPDYYQVLALTMSSGLAG